MEYHLDQILEAMNYMNESLVNLENLFMKRNKKDLTIQERAQLLIEEAELQDGITLGRQVAVQQFTTSAQFMMDCAVNIQYLAKGYNEEEDATTWIN